MQHVACQKDGGGALIIIAAGNWTFAECRFR